MKRSADTTLAGPSRRTRSVVRRNQANARAVQQQHSRASALMSTPLLQALPAVLSSGFLYEYDCLKAASICQNWYHAWKEVENLLPENAKVEIRVQYDRGYPPDWIQESGLEETIGTHEFVRQVFDKVNALKVVAKPSKAARARAEAALPKWGIDVQKADVYVWGPTFRNNGGICIDLGLEKNFKVVLPTGKYFLSGRAVWKCHLDPNLVLWTGIRSWRVYDGEPLWP